VYTANRSSARRAAAILALLISLSGSAQNDGRIAALYRERRFAEAARAIEKHLAQHPEDFSSRLLLGLCYQQVEDRVKAEEVLRDALRRRPGNADALFFLARVQYLLAKLPEAERNARASLESGGAPARAHNLIGLIKAEQLANEDALRAYETAIRSDSRFAEAYLNAGILLLKLRRTSEALERLNTAVELNARSAETLYHRARALLELGKTAEAEKDLVAAIGVDRYDPARRLLDQLRSGGVAAVRPGSAPAAGPAAVRFRNIAVQAGLSFVLENHVSPRKYLIETMPGGVAAFDYDNDGRIDIFFTNGAAIPSLEKSAPKYANRLYRNLGGMKFVDVTEEAGVAGRGYSMGAAAADYDNDGYADLFVAGVNRNSLFRNTGRGRFEDVTARSGIRGGLWSVAAGWFDYDNDGWLDLFVVNYLKWSPALDPYCGDTSSRLRVYCHPSRFEGLPNTLYRNRGDGTFEDVSERSGIASSIGKGMSVAFADYDQSGFLDVFVTNDTLPNFLFRNRGDGTFEELALKAGVAYTDDGKAVSSMGVDFRDYDNDGRPDLAITALNGETFPLFRNQGNGFFRDVTYPSRIGLASAARGGWCNGFFDFNNDGWKDLFSANSHVTDNIDRFRHHQYRQPNSLYLNLGDGTFRDVSDAAGPDFRIPRAHRGCAFADFDNDGKMDIVVTALGEPAELWQNITPGTHNWIGLRLEGKKSNRDGIGARISIGSQHNHMTTTVGYASSSRSGVHFGLGKTEKIERLEIQWPSGSVQVMENVPLNQVLVISEPN
jgi:tetratricopeptide (TPR) repeat protein